MDVKGYPTDQISSDEFRFFSVGEKGKFEMRIRFTLIRQSPKIYNLGFGIWNSEVDIIEDDINLRNGDTNLILATVGQKALEFIDKNPLANLVATGTVMPGQLALRTRKYQMGLSANYEFLVRKYNIYGFLAEKAGGRITGEWPFWKGRWQLFKKGINYDAFLLNLR